jgi:serine phosphatase RsbU (regulator of sigma subunit)
MDRLQAAVDRAASTHQDLGEIADEVLARIGEYAETREDDWTLLLVRRAA